MAKRVTSFADQAKAIIKKYGNRPDDNASKAAMNRELQALKEQQEMEREQMARDAMDTLNSLGYNEPQAPGMMGDQMPMHQMPDGSMMPGAYHGDPSVNQQKYGGGMCGCGKRGCKGCGGKMHKAYGGDMRKKYYNGGFGVELNTPDIPASYGYVPKVYETYGRPSVNRDSFDANLEDNYFLNANNFTTQEELDFLKAYQDAEAKTKKKDKPKDPTDPEGDTFEGKLSAGDIMGGLAQSAGDISGLAYAMKKPAPRGTVTARTLEFDPTMYDKAIAQGDLATRALSRANPNASLSAQIASSTAMRTAIGNEKAAQKFRIDAANATSEAEAERYNLRAQEMDRQAEDMRQMAISTHLTNLGDKYAGMRRDKKTMAMEAQIANMLGTENYTFKRNTDGSITIVPKI